jgi:hypothetical protein
MNKPDAAVWADLQYHWDSAYQFDYSEDPGDRKPFRVTRRDDPAKVLEAETPDELGRMIAEDYRRNPVPREVAP